LKNISTSPGSGVYPVRLYSFVDLYNLYWYSVIRIIDVITTCIGNNIKNSKKIIVEAKL
jgi:hypothetical protein